MSIDVKGATNFLETRARHDAHRPLFVSCGDLIADRRYKWALDHAARGDFSGAANILAQTVELAPSFATAWFALGAIRDRLGDRDGAIAAFGRAATPTPRITTARGCGSPGSKPAKRRL